MTTMTTTGVVEKKMSSSSSLPEDDDDVAPPPPPGPGKYAVPGRWLALRASTALLVDASARERPNANALLTDASQDGTKWHAMSYKKLIITIKRIAQAVRQTNAQQSEGGGAMALVGVCLPRGRSLVTAMLGVHRAGAGYVPLDPTYPIIRLKQYVADVNMRVAITTPETRRHLKELDSKDGNCSVEDCDEAWERLRWIELSEGDYENGGVNDDDNDDDDDDDDIIIAETTTTNGAAAAPPRNKQILPATAPAYCIFTSGSTGRPKGVLVSHRNLVGHLSAMQVDVCQLDASSNDVFFAVTTISFDIHALEIHLPLAMACTVALSPDGIARDGRRWLRSLQYTSARVLQAVPAAWDVLANAAADVRTPRDAKAAKQQGPITGRHGAVHLRLGLCGGEAMLWQLATKLMGSEPLVARLVNVYGPTEATVWASYHNVNHRMVLDESATNAPSGVVPIGRALKGYALHVVDSSALDRGEMCFVEPGVVGELVISGVGVSDVGYLEVSDEARELNKRKFIDDVEVEPGLRTRVYRTGDAASVDASTHSVLFHGRMDGQVKIRGFRVEVGEVENVVAETLTNASEDDLRDLVVELPEEDKEQKRRRWMIAADAREARLIVWVSASPPLGEVPRDMHELFTRWLLSKLVDRLPAHMLPSAVVMVPGSMPTTLNGKVDRKALSAEIAMEGMPLSPRGGPPRNAVEQRVMQIWYDLFMEHSITKGNPKKKLTAAGGINNNMKEAPAPESDTTGSDNSGSEKSEERSYSIGREAHFRSELGGTSLQETELQRRLEHAFGVALPPGFAATLPNIASQANALRIQGEPLRRLPLICHVAERKEDPDAWMRALYLSTPPYVPPRLSVLLYPFRPVVAWLSSLRCLREGGRIRRMKMRPSTLDDKTAKLLTQVPLDADSAYLATMPITRCLASSLTSTEVAGDVELGGIDEGLPSVDTASSHILTGLQKAIDVFPALASRLDCDANGRLYTTCKDGYVAVTVEKEIEGELKRRKMPSWLPGFVNQWNIPQPNYVVISQWMCAIAFWLSRTIYHVLLCHICWLPRPQLAVHVCIVESRRSTGRAVGVRLSVSYSHSLGDETTGDDLWRAWSRACRGEALLETGVPESSQEMEEQEHYVEKVHKHFAEHLGPARWLTSKGSVQHPKVSSGCHLLRFHVTCEQLSVMCDALGCDASEALAGLAFSGSSASKVSFVADLRNARPQIGIQRTFANAIAYSTPHKLQLKSSTTTTTLHDETNDALVNAVGARNAASLLRMKKCGVIEQLAEARRAAVHLPLHSLARIGELADGGSLFLVNDVSHFESSFDFGIFELHSNTSDGLMGTPASNRVPAELFLENASVRDVDVASLRTLHCSSADLRNTAMTVMRAPAHVGGGMVVTVYAGIF